MLLYSHSRQAQLSIKLCDFYLYVLTGTGKTIMFSLDNSLKINLTTSHIIFLALVFLSLFVFAQNFTAAPDERNHTQIFIISNDSTENHSNQNNAKTKIKEKPDISQKTTLLSSDVLTKLI